MVVPRVEDDVSDTELRTHAACGDRRAFEVLFERHRSRLVGVCRRITCDEHDAQDALQETLILAWRSLKSFDGRSGIGTWLYRVAVNASIDEVRRRNRRATPTEELPERPVDRSEVDGVSTRLDVDRALRRLPPQFRAAIVLRELCDLSYREIAELRDVPIDTVKSQISRGRQALAQELGPVAATSGPR
ncbi:RNA polymerase sigma factor [Actinomycetospora atypica]|uniref:RNA polymerase sigma factor n=1 Tax=Actinomycetospora atypica TaxID=1290095 RepID=A0ABV9YI81_9PSEU